MKYRPIALLGLAALAGSAWPAAAQDAGDERFVVVKAGRVITVSGEEIPGGVIIIVNGKIRSVGKGIDYPGNAKIIDARELVVMPGLINPESRFGLPNYQRSGVNGNLLAADEYFPRDDLYRDLLDAGYTTLGVTPDGSGITGRAMIVRTAGAPDARILEREAYVWMTAEIGVLRGAVRKAREEIEKVEKARKEFEEKQKQAAASQPAVSAPAASQPATGPASRPAFKPPEMDAKHQAVVELLQKKAGLSALVELRGGSDFLHVEDVFKDTEVARAFRLRYGLQSDFLFVVEKLGERKARVVMSPMINWVPHSVERVHLLKRVTDAGCEVTIAPMADTAAEHRAVLPRLVNVVRNGWPRELALKSVTLHPARLLGLEARLGSIEKGKDADLIFLDGDPLDMLTRVRKVMIAGEIVHTVTGDVR